MCNSELGMSAFIKARIIVSIRFSGAKRQILKKRIVLSERWRLAWLMARLNSGLMPVGMARDGILIRPVHSVIRCIMKSAGAVKPSTREAIIAMERQSNRASSPVASGLFGARWIG